MDKADEIRARADRAPPPAPRDPVRARLPFPGGEAAVDASFARTTMQFVVAIGTVATLYLAREVLIPLALAGLLSFALAPAVQRMRRLGVPRPGAVLAVVSLAFVAILGFALVIGLQFANLANNLPRYERNIDTKIERVIAMTQSNEFASRMMRFLRGARAETPRAAPAPAPPTPASPAEADAPAPAAPPPAPVPVQVEPPPPTPLDTARNVLGPLIDPLTAAGVVILFVFVMLLNREDLRERLIRLAGVHDLQRTTEALDEAAQRVTRYLLAQLLVNVVYAVPLTIGLYFVGVPNPLLWGMFMMVFRFVPYVGPVAGAVLPLALAIAVEPGWTTFIWAASLILVLELVVNNVIEPIFYGATTGLSAMAIILAAIFWTWLWGAVGLLLSTPLTVCAVVIGRHVPQLRFLDVLLGNRPVLAPAQRFYQRALAGDSADATEQAEAYLEEKSIEALHAEVTLPALALAEADRARGVLDQQRRIGVAAVVAEMLFNLLEYDGDPPARDASPPPPAATRVLCAGGRGDLDDAAAAVIADLLRRRGVAVRTASFEALTPAELARQDLEEPGAVCVAYLNSDSALHARYLVRRLRRRLPDVKVVIALCGGRDASAEAIAAVGADAVTTDLTATLAAVTGEERAPAERPEEPAHAA